MKKLFVLFALLSWISMTYALDFNISNYQKFDENAGMKGLWDVIIDTQWESVQKFTLSISDTDYLIFDAAVSAVADDRADVTIEDISPLSGNKKLVIEFAEPMIGKITLSGIQVRLYDRKIRWAKIGIDYKGDTVPDAYSTNYIDLDDNNRYSDTMRVLPITNLKEEVTGNTIKFTWTASIDLDTVWTLVRTYKSTEFVPLKETFIGKDETQEILIDGLDRKNNYRFEFHAKDNYYLTNTPVVFRLVSVSDDIEEEAIPNEPGSIPEQDIEKIMPVFTTKVFANFMVKFDALISQKTYKKEVIEIRNNIITTLKKYEDKKISKTLFKSELTRLATEFKKQF